MKKLIRGILETVFPKPPKEYRSDAGVKFIQTEDGDFQLDFDDPYNRELLNKLLLEMCRMDVVDGQLIIGRVDKTSQQG